MENVATFGNQRGLFDPEPSGAAIAGYSPFAGPTALEDDGFPFERLSEVAELESWRKEVNRPIYHMHKWWARRLGTVFRAIALGALSPSGTDLMEAFYSGARLTGAVVFDPFMGSGTTIGETIKLGARGIGRDINPVATFLVRNAHSSHDRRMVELEFRSIERDVADKLRKFYVARQPDGTVADVLYNFWVMVAECPNCAAAVDLFPSRIFARHTNPGISPLAHALCPECGEVNTVRYDAELAVCSSCSCSYNPQCGTANGQKAACTCCEEEFSIAAGIRESGNPPKFRMYAKLALISDGRKVYQRATEQDAALYREAEAELRNREGGYPLASIQPGYNTNQVLGYNYRHWYEMFNARQLLCLSLLAERIKRIDDAGIRNLFVCLFSGILEFNNMFASFKGEGTGAVRHMFSHHILKPERTPLEANIWGTRKSSGSFMTLFRGRILRALDYADNPFEIAVRAGGSGRSAEKVHGLSDSLGCDIAECYRDFDLGKRLYLSCGDSGSTDLPDGCVDAVITDPPFFDNVHYSQLADFFHVWQRHVLDSDGEGTVCTTRSELEVQNGDESVFSARLEAVLAESHRVLRDDGLLAFTYHHSRAEGWRSLLSALIGAEFVVTAAFPIKSEMSVALPKRQAKEPIDHDVILACRKRQSAACSDCETDLLEEAAATALGQVSRLRAHGRRLSRIDIRVIVYAQILKSLSCIEDRGAALKRLNDVADDAESCIDNIHRMSVE